MAQKQYTTYQADILSFELRDALLGIIKPGRYIGYNSMTEYQAQSGSNVYCRIGHTTGIAKYNKANPPVLEATRGVAVSTQGTLVAEDGNVDITVVVSTNPDYTYHIVYMEHYYIEVLGANPATYGIILGTPGAGLPTLTSPTKRVIIGIIYEGPYTDDFSGLTWHPYKPGVGDELMYSKLFRKTNYHTYDEGSQPNNGIIGNRAFTSNNYITDYESLTDVISDLDGAIKTEETARIAVGNRPIDSALWGNLTDITQWDVSISRHGLVPKAPNDITQFLRGDATWAVPPAGFIYTGISQSAHHANSTARGGIITMGTTYEWDVSSIVPAGFTQVFIRVILECLWGSDNSSGRSGVVAFTEGGTDNNGCRMEGPPPFSSTSMTGSPSHIYWSHTGLVKLSSNRIIRVSFGNHAGSTTDWMYDIMVQIVAYR